MDDLLGRRFMMSDGCLRWRPAKAHRAFPLSSIPPPVFTLPRLFSSFFYFSRSLIFSQPIPVSFFTLSSFSPSRALAQYGVSVVSAGAGNPVPRHFSSQCPRLQCSCGVLTAESPHHAQALGLFSAAQAKCAGPTLHCIVWDIAVD